MASLSTSSTPRVSSLGFVPSVVACDLSVFTPTERAEHQRQFAALFRELAHEVRELDDGFELQFREDAGLDLVSRVEAWVAKERRCCPFFTFELRVPAPGAGPVVLRILGGEEAKAVMRSELEARGIAIQPGAPGGNKGKPPAAAPLGSASLVAGAGAVLCVLGCAAPMLAVGGLAGSAFVTAAGYAEATGMFLVVGGVVSGAAILVRNALRRSKLAAPSGCGCSGSSGGGCG